MSRKCVLYKVTKQFFLPHFLFLFFAQKISSCSKQKQKKIKKNARKKTRKIKISIFVTMSRKFFLASVIISVGVSFSKYFIISK